MAEAEDVLTDVARHATVFAQNLWRKYHPSTAASRTVSLMTAAPRLDFLVTSVFNRSYSFRVAQAPARPTLLATALRHSQSPYSSKPVPATDNNSIWLPADIDIEDPSLALEIYRVMALQQAIRARRGSAEFIPRIKNPLWRDLFLLLEAHAANQDLLEMLPGLQRSCTNFRAMALQLRPPLSAFSSERKRVEILYRELLSGSNKLPKSATAYESFVRSEKLFADMAGDNGKFSLRVWSSEPLLKDLWIGELRAPTTQSSGEEIAGGDSYDKPPRSTHLSRRPEVRNATEGEDKQETSSAWMVQGDESHPHAEDPLGMQRPVDRDEDIEATEFGDLVSELAQARLVATASQPKEVLLSDDSPESQARRAESQNPSAEEGWDYPEWDYRIKSYRNPGARVLRIPVGKGSQKWVEQTLEAHRNLIDSIRRQFEMLRARRILFRKQVDGDEIDLDAYIESRADFRAGSSFNEALYQTRRATERNVAITLLIDISGSTDGWISANRRVIDVEREALLLVCIALESMGEPYSVVAFSGDGPRAVKVQQIKAFDERFNNDVALKISSLEPENYTRVGAAMRHATAQLMATAAAHKLLLLLSDGKPHDNDLYEGRYGVEDTRQAVIEAKLQGISTFCLTIDRQAANYLPAIFGKHAYALLPKPELLPKVLLEWMKRLLEQ
jgi:nitric oxide reductase NorD protein